MNEKDKSTILDSAIAEVTNMRKYWIMRGRFANEYSLAYTTGSDEEEQANAQGWERITRREAISLCVRERRARLEEPQFSGYAPEYIYPWMTGDEYKYTDFDNYPWAKIGYLVVKL